MRVTLLAPALLALWTVNDALSQRTEAIDQIALAKRLIIYDFPSNGSTVEKTLQDIRWQSELLDPTQKV